MGTETFAHQESRMLLMEGALIVDKPADMTSHTAVAHVRRILGTRRVGHTGTLDPFATGVLVILFGKATRLMQFLNGAEKEYEAVVRFGYATDTGDLTGQRLAEPADANSPSHLTGPEIQNAISSLRGEIEQLPPMYSAKKVRGRKLYELARRGEEIERQPVRVHIKTFDAIEKDDRLLKLNEDGTADLAVRVVCSAGTYIRTLAEDLGKQLGVGAHLAALRRTRAGAFRIDEAHTLDRLRQLAEAAQLPSVLISADAAIAHLPALEMNADDVRRALNGLNVYSEHDHQHQQPLRLRNAAGELVGIGVYDSIQKAVHPQVMLRTAESVPPAMTSD